MTADRTVRDWVQARVPCEVTHLDAAACGRVSAAALQAEIEHLRQEAAHGGYVAEEQNALIGAGRTALAGLVGLTGADLAFTENGGRAFATLLEAWPLPAGARMGTVPSEYGGNAAVLRSLADRLRWELVSLPVDALGRVTDVPAGLDLLTLPQIASHCGVLQPVADLVGTGVPVVLDVAQSLGQSPVPTGCAAYVGTSRKWLCGPRGVGILIVAPDYAAALAAPATLAPAVHQGMRRFESMESHVAGRAGLSVAVGEWSPELVPVGHELAQRLRTLLAEDGTWQVVEPVEEPTAITTLRPRSGQDPVDVRSAMISQGFLTSAIPVSRSADLRQPVLRLSTPAWLTGDDLGRCAEALRKSSVGPRR